MGFIGTLLVLVAGLSWVFFEETLLEQLAFLDAKQIVALGAVAFLAFSLGCLFNLE